MLKDLTVSKTRLAQLLQKQKHQPATVESAPQSHKEKKHPTGIIDVMTHNGKKLTIMTALLMLILVIFAISHAFYHSPTAAIKINPEGLTSTQYGLLNSRMQDEPTVNFFTANLQNFRDKALQLSWVDEVSVMRDWQKGIVITVLPKKAVAHFGSEHLIDAKANVFVPANESELLQNHLANLHGAKDKAPIIMQKMEQVNEIFAPLNQKVQDIILTPRMTWIIGFDNGLKVIVDNEDMSRKLLNLTNVLSHQLQDRRDDIQSVDLRYKNGFAISWKNTPKSQPSV